MSGAVGRAIWGPFDRSWLALATLRRVALRLGYLSWGLIMMLLSRSLRRLCSLSRLQPSVGCWAWQVPTGAPPRNVALELWMHRSGVGLGFTLCVCVYVSLHNPGSVKYLCWVILLHLWFCSQHSNAGWVIQFYTAVHQTQYFKGTSLDPGTVGNRKCLNFSLMFPHMKKNMQLKHNCVEWTVPLY